MRPLRTTVLLLASTGLLTACMNGSTSLTGVGPDSPTVLGVAPASAAIGVSPAVSVTITFSRSMMAGMESLVVLHENSVTGAQVTGVATWSADRTVLTFTPSAALTPGTTYRLHLSPALTGMNGRPVDLGACAGIGGQYVSSGMMGVASGGSMMNGPWGPGMMTSGWRATDGTFGMFFTFTTS